MFEVFIIIDFPLYSKPRNKILAARVNQQIKNSKNHILTQASLLFLYSYIPTKELTRLRDCEVWYFFVHKAINTDSMYAANN